MNLFSCFSEPKPARLIERGIAKRINVVKGLHPEYDHAALVRSMQTSDVPPDRITNKTIKQDLNLGLLPQTTPPEIAGDLLSSIISKKHVSAETMQKAVGAFRAMQFAVPRERVERVADTVVANWTDARKTAKKLGPILREHFNTPPEQRRNAALSDNQISYIAAKYLHLFMQHQTPARRFDQSLISQITRSAGDGRPPQAPGSHDAPGASGGGQLFVGSSSSELAPRSASIDETLIRVFDRQATRAQRESETFINPLRSRQAGQTEIVPADD